MNSFISFVENAGKYAGADDAGLLEAILDGYDAICESGIKFSTTDQDGNGLMFQDGIDWTESEDQMIMNGIVPKGRTAGAAHARLMRLRSSGKIPRPEKKPTLSMTQQEQDEYMATRNPPERVLERYGGDRNRAKKYCDAFFYKLRKKKERQDEILTGVIASPKHNNIWSADELKELMSTGKCSTRPSSSWQNKKNKLYNFIISNELRNESDDEIIRQYMDYVSKFGQKKRTEWKDDQLLPGNVPYLGSESMQAVIGLIPDNHGVPDTAHRRNVAMKHSAIAGIRRELDDPEYLPSTAEINDYIKRKHLRNEYSTRYTPTAADLNTILERPDLDVLNGLSKERIESIRYQLRQQGFAADAAPFTYGGRRGKDYDKRDRHA